MASTRDLAYFFNLASSLYRDAGPPSQQQDQGIAVAAAPPSYLQSQANNTTIDHSAVCVLWLFRQTRPDVRPVCERFHLGPADRQPLYALTARPSIRCATEFNELSIQRREPVRGVWAPVVTAEIEPSLELVKPGNWPVAKLALDSVPVWRQVVAGSVVAESLGVAGGGLGNALRLSWGDRRTIGVLGDAYGLWWETGGPQGLPEAFFVVEGWNGFDVAGAGVIRVRLQQTFRSFHCSLTCVLMQNVPTGQVTAEGSQRQLARSPSQYG